MTVSTHVALSANRRLHVARWISTVCHPLCQVYFVLLVVGAVFGLRGVLLGLLMATLMAGIPGLILWRLVRVGHVVDMDVSTRPQRPLVLGVSLVFLVAGFAVLRLLDAPTLMLRVVLAMAIGLVVAATISKLWKISIHVAVTAGAVSALSLAVSHWFWTLLPLLIIVGWARLTVRAHTSWQVIIGAVVGAVVSLVSLHGAG